MEFWEGLYIELAQKIQAAMPEILWVDMWHNQTDFLDENLELPFPMPAVFIDFDADEISTLPGGVQDIEGTITFYLAVDCLADTYQGSVNQESALEFTRLMGKLHKAMQGSEGEHYSDLNRTGFVSVESGGNPIVKGQSFYVLIRDYSAVKEPGASVVDPKLDVQNGQKPARPAFGVYDEIEVS